ncbi:hypothetical protein ACQEV2_31150 [Streptomyces sp. CA-251387]|uniref:hypothetical protein n=1 Tax=Streptomyces sp. CA-251387 TaxID=3240064 RepID=UPI003D8E943A
MKTDASGRQNLRKAGAGGLGVGPAAAKRSVGGRIGVGLLGILFVLFSLVLVGSGYEEGPRKVARGTAGTITIEQCRKDVGDEDVECSGTFRSDDGRVRYGTEDFELDGHYDKGEKVQAVADGPGWYDRGTFTTLYVEGVRFWCIAAAMFGIAVLLLSSAFRSGGRPRRRWAHITGLSLLFGGLLGCGLCVLVNSVLI